MAATPEKIGPYDVLKTLGQGGMGVVYLARDARSGVTVALKTVLVAQASLVHNIRREIHSLVRLAHPGIVRILAHGLDEGLPWYAMELAHGRTLRQLMGDRVGAETPTTPFSIPDVDATTPLSRLRPPAHGHDVASGRFGGPLRPDEAMALVRRLCAPLRYLHGEGLVHRDLKPDNVLVRADGSVLLIDFGLTGTFGGREGWEARDWIGETAGTLGYIAPEQALGREVDARADLYALGCVLYELLTGRPPFVGAAMQVLQQHLFVTPLPPSHSVPGVSPELDRVVLRLLEKSPANRYGYADDLASALRELGASDDPSPDTQPPRLYLYRPGFAGRKGLFESLEAPLRRAIAGQGQILLLSGETGVGKTRVALELTRVAAERGMFVLCGQCEPDGGQPLQGLRRPLQTIADLCREQGEATSDRLLGARAKVLAPYEPGLLAIPGQERHPPPEPLSGAPGRTRVLRSLVDTFVELGSDQATLLLIDDAQWLDELGQAFLGAAARALSSREARLAIVVVYRREGRTEALDALARQDVSTAVEIPRLEPSEVAEMAGSMLAIDAVPPEMVEDLARDSEGNPYFVTEYLRTAAEHGLLDRDPEGHWRYHTAPAAEWRNLAIPHSLRDLMDRRLEALSEGARRLLACAAILGRTTTSDLLLRTAGGGDASLEQLDELVRREVLEVDGPSLHFNHQKLRDVVLEGIDVAQSRALHRVAAEVIEAFPENERQEHLAALGAHWEHAGELGRAAPCYLAAARGATGNHAMAEAERLYRAYLALPGSGNEALGARVDLAERVLFAMGRLADADAEAVGALQGARGSEQVGLLGKALRALAVVRAVRGRSDEARELLGEAEHLAQIEGDVTSEAFVARHLANIDIQQGRFADAHRRFEGALRLFREVGDEAEEAISLGNLGVVLLDEERLEEAETVLAEAALRHGKAGRRRSEAISLGNLALAKRGRGCPDEARALLERALATHRAVGDRACEATALTNLANGWLHQERPAEALPLLGEGIAIHREIGNRRSEAIALANLATVHASLGTVVRAREMAAEARAIVAELGDRHMEVLVMDVIATIEAEAGHDARTAFAAALEACRKVGDRRLEARLLLKLGHHHEEQRRLADARQAVDEAHVLAESVGVAPTLAATLSLSADLHRHAGDLDAATVAASQASTIFASLRPDAELGLHQCVLARIARSRGEPADEDIARAASLLGMLDLGEESRLGRALRALRDSS